MQVVQVRDLTFAYRDGKTVLNKISFSVSAGEILVIAGLSGCGKTTLCHLLSGIIPHAVQGDISGEINILGFNPQETPLAQNATRVGLVFQDADSQIICTTVEDEVAFGMENLCYPPEEINERVTVLLEEFGFSHQRLTNPAQLSGGRKKLLTIAGVLALSPALLIMDEPLSSLDSTGRDLVRSAIEDQRRQGRTIILVEHDLNLVTFADRWLLLHEGGIALLDTPAQVNQQPELLEKLGLML